MKRLPGQWVGARTLDGEARFFNTHMTGVVYADGDGDGWVWALWHEPRWSGWAKTERSAKIACSRAARKLLEASA